MKEFNDKKGVDISGVAPALVLRALYNHARGMYQEPNIAKTISTNQAERMLAAQDTFHKVLGKMLAVRFEPAAQRVVFLTDHNSDAGTAYNEYNGGPATTKTALAQARCWQREAEIGKPTGFNPVVVKDGSATRPAAFTPPKGADSVFIVK